MVFTGKYEFCGESGDEKILAIEHVETYRELLIEWKEFCKREQKQKDIISTFPLRDRGTSLNHLRVGRKS